MAKIPRVGEPAPDFELPGTDGTFKLSDHRGERVVLLFYPGDNTMVCTKQFCSYRDRAEDLASLGATVVGISESIRVVSVVGRLLEHSRVYAFERDGEQTVYIASADLMPRNLDHRVELAAPILAPELQAELMDTLERAFADNQNSWEMDSTGSWTRRSPGPGESPRSMQLELAELYSGRAGEPRAGESRDGLAAEAVDGARAKQPRRVAEPTPWALRPGSL